MKIRKGVAATAIALAVAATGLSSSPASAHGSHEQARERHHQHHHHKSFKNAKTSKATLTAVVSGMPEQVEPVTVRAEGALNYKTQQGAFDLQVPDGQGGVTTTAIVIDGSSVYVQVPEEALAETGGKSWVKSDTKQAGESLGIDLGMFNENGEDGAMFESAVTDVTEVGKERVNGVKTKHYEITLDFAAAAEQESDAVKKESLSTLAALYGNEPLVADAWVDRRDRLRKMSFSLDLSKLQVPGATPEQQLTGTIDFTADFYEFGTDVEIHVPSADEVATIDEVVASEQPAAPAAA